MLNTFGTGFVWLCFDYLIKIFEEKSMLFLFVYIFFLHVSNFVRYEWKHRGLAHIHGFMWLFGAPDMEAFDWLNVFAINKAKNFFDKYVTTWNPHDIHHRNVMVP